MGRVRVWKLRGIGWMRKVSRTSRIVGKCMRLRNNRFRWKLYHREFYLSMHALALCWALKLRSRAATWSPNELDSSHCAVFLSSEISSSSTGSVSFFLLFAGLYGDLVEDKQLGVMDGGVGDNDERGSSKVLNRRKLLMICYMLQNSVDTCQLFLIDLPSHFLHCHHIPLMLKAMAYTREILKHWLETFILLTWYFLTDYFVISLWQCCKITDN